MTMTWKGDAVLRELQRRCEVAARKGAERLLETSNTRVPDDPTKPMGSDLKRSGKVTSDGDTSAVSYGTEYAVLQHEVMRYDHRPGQQAKFLETAMAEELRRIRAIMARELQL